MSEGTLPEFAVQQIISGDKTLGECQGEDLPTAFDYVQNTADGVDSDSDYPQASNVKGKSGHCEWDGNQVTSVTSWNYSVPPCTGRACDNQDAAAFATVVAKRERCSIDLCEHCILGSVHERCFHEDFNPAYHEMDHCVHLVGFDTAASFRYEAEFTKLPYGANACSVASEAVLHGKTTMRRVA